MIYFIIIFFIEAFTYLIVLKASHVLLEKDFFPRIDNSLLKKFNSFDQDLGWVNKKNTVKISDGIRYTFNKKGARSVAI